ncbi:MAG: Uma2 family endonuclease [Anaerolineae bacterium]
MALPKPRWTEVEYLAFERSSEERHEFIDGEVVAMSGASERHNRIVMNTSNSLYNQIGDRPCSVYATDMRVQVRVGARRQYTYPDVVVVCGAVELAGDDFQDTLLNPTVIIEVLSPSTEAYDRGKKFTRYQTLESLQEYILIAQDSIQIDRYLRQPDKQWLLLSTQSGEGEIELPSIGCTVRAPEVYRNVKFDEAASEEYADNDL